jgi:capsular exopolysaccharide synthesis family protein
MTIREGTLIEDDAVHGRDATDSVPGLPEELVSFRAPASVEADQYRTLRHAVERLRHDSGFQVFAVTSAHAGDGKTVTSLNLAGSLAQSPETRVLLVDADLHRCAVAEYLGLAELRSPGLAQAILNKEYGLAQAVRRLDLLNVSVLPAGDAQAQPYELLASPRIEGLLAEARRLYDYVLIDTPPVVPLADCRLLGRWVDGFIVVVAAHKTPRKLVAEALNLLEPAKVLGMVFNGDDQPLAPYYGYYSHQHPPSQVSAGPSGWWRRARHL